MPYRLNVSISAAFVGCLGKWEFGIIIEKSFPSTCTHFHSIMMSITHKIPFSISVGCEWNLIRVGSLIDNYVLLEGLELRRLDKGGSEMSALLRKSKILQSPNSIRMHAEH